VSLVNRPTSGRARTSSTAPAATEGTALSTVSALGLANGRNRLSSEATRSASVTTSTGPGPGHSSPCVISPPGRRRRGRVHAFRGQRVRIVGGVAARLGAAVRSWGYDEQPGLVCVCTIRPSGTVEANACSSSSTKATSARPRLGSWRGVGARCG
jgi:hypothetical protein